jgi:hypothetical protein
MSRAGFSALANPTQWPSKVTESVGPNGSFTNGVTSGLDGLGGAQGVSLGTTFQNTKGSFWNDAIQSQVPINQHYYVDASDSTLNETGAKQAIFMSKTPGRRGGSHYTRSYKMLGVSALNYKLRYDPDFINCYGNEPNTLKFQQDWSFAGVQQTQPSSQGIGAKQKQLVVTLTVGRRARMYCPHVMLRYTSSDRDVVANHDKLFFVMRRYPLPDEAAQQFEKKRENMYRGKRTLAEEYGWRDSGGDMVDIPEEPEQPKPKVKGQYYWKLEPYVSRDNAVPPLSAYSYAGDKLDWAARDETAWVGCFFYLGIVHECHGDMGWEGNKANVAKKFLYPEAAGDGYKESGNRIADVVIQVAV